MADVAMAEKCPIAQSEMPFEDSSSLVIGTAKAMDGQSASNRPVSPTSTTYLHTVEQLCAANNGILWSQYYCP